MDSKFPYLTPEDLGEFLLKEEGLSLFENDLTQETLIYLSLAYVALTRLKFVHTSQEEAKNNIQRAWRHILQLRLTNFGDTEKDPQRGFFLTRHGRIERIDNVDN